MAELDESFEVHSRALLTPSSIKQYKKLSDLVDKLRNNPTPDDLFCAAHAIKSLAYRLDAANATKRLLYNKLEVMERAKYNPPHP